MRTWRGENQYPRGAVTTVNAEGEVDVSEIASANSEVIRIVGWPVSHSRTDAVLFDTVHCMGVLAVQFLLSLSSRILSYD